MFKKDGTAIKNPVAYVARLDMSRYDNDLFDASGKVIRNPQAYAEAIAAPKASNSTSRSHNDDVDVASAVMFKADGKPIRDPEAYVARLELGSYKGDLKDRNGRKIKDPVAYVASLSKKVPRSRLPTGPPPGLGGGSSEAVLFKADGTAVRDPVAYVAGMRRKGGEYEGGLFNSKGEEIRDPDAYVAWMGLGVSSVETTAPRRSLPTGRADSGPVGRYAKPQPVGMHQDAADALYKEDGTPVRDPVAYISGMERKPGGYQGGLFNAKGIEIRDPAAYLRGMVGGGSRGPPMTSSSAAPIGARRERSAGATAAGAAPLERQFFKADGTQVRDVEAYVKAMERSGGYKGGLFNHRGEEVRDPSAYVRGMQRDGGARAGGGTGGAGSGQAYRRPGPY
eukprot:TRINITY_DN74210_c0_g1_i1.p2 TRINITY_DN74210_c0_g1~~TRINITY_DN74210_c0_g1_i1.p2  ORF type:complete len:394 (-),score=72.93 TRINITY_DN74210_c0_g1_i1:103-1284(-)